ncbi:prolyl-tRNA synthetase associated domain-containing protein [Deminuibacter soli]|uniref:Prolyl-tRNA synthetase associated domain-containing protein n=1 Tax=Deminuibacter soli TaxID=2291815 RepID=A0A3E1NEQ6_9BACT|nr:YbaK/EbsC family protein [Deminuibacter soli]RFM26463.1 prolyl-tRNA synthetase associated domain-containing protein [Deminuibacter soli]
MFYVSEIITTAPATCKNELQQLTYAALNKLEIPFERVDTDDAISMEDCILIDEKLSMKTVKTLFLCNRQQTQFYLYITVADKPFSSKDFSKIMGVSRLSFAPENLLLQKLGVKIGAATIFGVLLDPDHEIKVVIDKAILQEEWYGCSDGTTTGYMKVKTTAIVNDFLHYANHKPVIIEMDLPFL